MLFLFLGCSTEAPIEPTPLPPPPMPCNVENKESITKACERCVDSGCPLMPDEFTCEESWLRHSDMMLCVQFPGVIENCSDCIGLRDGMPISTECRECAKNHSPCNFDCSMQQF